MVKVVSERAVSEVLSDNLDINVNAWDSGVGNKTKNAGEIFDIYRFSFCMIYFSTVWMLPLFAVITFYHQFGF